MIKSNSVLFDFNDFSNKDLYLSERNIYGSSRVGVENVNQIIASTNTANININSENTSITCAQKMGDKHYELSNHLGNVLEVISDRKYSNDNGSGGVDYYLADVVSFSDYFPFGMMLPGRNGSADDYRYGFNGMEKDDEIKGDGNSYDFGARIYDARIGRWLSLDRVEKIHESGYAAFGNNPIFFKDIGGNDTVIAIYYSYQVVNGIQIKVYSYEKIKETSEVGSKLTFEIYESGNPNPQKVDGWKSPTNPKGLDQTSGAGSQLSQTSTKYDANGRAKTAKSYELLNIQTTTKYYGDAIKGSYAINGFGYVIDLEIQFNMSKVNLTRTDLANFVSAMDQLDKINQIILQGVTTINPLSGNNVTIRNVQVLVMGYHSPEPSPYNPPSGTQANTDGKTGNDALDVNRAASVAKYISNATGVRTTAGSGGVGTRRTAITVMGNS